MSCLAGYEVSGEGSIVANASVYCLGGIVAGASASITPIATVTANGIIQGEGWTPVTPSSDTWTPSSASSDTWTTISPSSDTWLRQG